MHSVLPVYHGELATGRRHARVRRLAPISPAGSLSPINPLTTTSFALVSRLSRAPDFDLSSRAPIEPSGTNLDIVFVAGKCASLSAHSTRDLRELPPCSTSFAPWCNVEIRVPMHGQVNSRSKPLPSRAVSKIALPQRLRTLHTARHLLGALVRQQSVTLGLVRVSDEDRSASSKKAVAGGYARANCRLTGCSSKVRTYR